MQLKEKNSVRFRVKQDPLCNYLPVLPDPVEEKLFFEGRSAWTYAYTNEVVKINKKSKQISFTEDMGVRPTQLTA